MIFLIPKHQPNFERKVYKINILLVRLDALDFMQL